MKLVLTVALDRDVGAPAPRGERGPTRHASPGENRAQVAQVTIEGDFDLRPCAAQRREVAAGRGPALNRQARVGGGAVFDGEAHRHRISGERDPVARAHQAGDPHPVLLLARELGEVKAPQLLPVHTLTLGRTGDRGGVVPQHVRTAGGAPHPGAHRERRSR